MLARSVLVAFAFLSTASIVSAATVTSIAGQVSVNRGTGFLPLTDGAEVAAGERITVPPGGAARVVFSATCTLSLPAGQTFTVPAEVPCTAGGGIDPGLVAAGLVVVGGAAATIIGVSTINSDDGSETPVSP